MSTPSSNMALFFIPWAFPRHRPQWQGIANKDRSRWGTWDTISLAPQRRWIFRANFVSIQPRVETNIGRRLEKPPIFLIGDTATTQKWWISQPAMLVYRSVSPKPESGWWFQPNWKICSSNWKPSPIFGVKIKNSWNHHLVNVSGMIAAFPLPINHDFGVTNRQLGRCNLHHLEARCVWMFFFFSVFIPSQKKRRKHVVFCWKHRTKTKNGGLEDRHPAGVKYRLFCSWTSIQYPGILLIVSNEKGCS